MCTTLKKLIKIKTNSNIQLEYKLVAIMWLSVFGYIPPLNYKKEVRQNGLFLCKKEREQLLAAKTKKTRTKITNKRY